jgi:hypothetical protein
MLFNRLAWAPRNGNLIGKTASITGITGKTVPAGPNF